MKKTRNSHVNVEDCINWEGVGKAFKCFRGAEPFDHCVIDNFFTDEFAKHLESEIPEFESDVWQKYNNPIEIKKITSEENKLIKFNSQLEHTGTSCTDENRRVVINFNY